MKKLLLISLIASLILSVNFLFAETIIVKIPIVKNGQPLTDTLDNGQIITFQTSSDDAEQENDEMDAYIHVF